jgi:hypothetical protein
VEKVIAELAVGEALISVLDEKGTPTVVERALVCPPRSRLTPLTPEERMQVVRSSVLYGHYEQTIDRESAYEKLKARADSVKAEPQEGPGPARRPAETKSEATRLLEAMAKSAAHAVGSQIGRQIIRGVLGSLFGSGRRR